MTALTVLLALALQVAPTSPADVRDAATAVADSLFGPETSDGREGESDACRRDGTTLQMNVCVAEDLAQEEARMLRYLALALERAAATDADSGQYGDPTRQVELLTSAQAAWADYAEFRCQGEWDEVKGGTIRTIVLVGCRIDATRQRTHDIWADHLTYWDTTPPLLPEPVLTVFEEQEAARRP